MASYIPGPIPPYRTHQSADSATFTAPPLDTTLTLPEIFDFNRRNSADHIFYRYNNDAGELVTVKWGATIKAVHRVARRVKEVTEAAGISPSDPKKPVFGILAAADMMTYITVLMGILRAGYVGFPISNRNSPAAVAHLLGKTNAKYIFSTRDAPTISLVEAGIATLGEASHADASGGAFKPEILTMPLFEEIFNDEEGFEYLEDMEKPDLDSPAIILHSSGSTAFPKPIIQTHRNMLEHCRHPYYNEADYGKEIMAAHGLPPFHAVGVACFCWATSAGLQLGVFKPSSPPVIPTPQKVFEGIAAVEATRAFVVPMFLEAWSKDESYVEVLKSLRGIVYSGGPMNKQIGDELTAKGVSIRPAYGSTETGFMNVVFSHEPMGEDWEYFEFSDHLNPGLLDNGSGEFEMHIVPCPSSTPAVINTTWGDLPAYSTNDLLVPHPTRPGFWKVYGRADDQIMLSTGEKTNPGPMEAILSRHPQIHAAIMFGRGRFQNGVIIEPKPQYQFDPSDEEKLAAFRSAIWSKVEEANDYAPTHSRLFKEMIIVAHPDKPMAFTPKGTPKRSVILRDYEAEIEAAYASVEESSLSDIQAPKSWTPGETLTFVREVAKKVLKAEVVKDDDDIFNQHGADSLQVTWIRNSVLHALRSSEISVKDVPQNFVYNYPTVARLSKFIARIVSPDGGEDGKSELEQHVEELQEMVAKYSTDFPQHKPVKAPLSDVVLLTGTTGALGTNILEMLVASPEVKRIYALNRPDRNGATSRDRHIASFKDRGMDLALADNEKVVYIEGDPAFDNFGLSREMFEEVRDTVTHYIHNAWRVDFNVSLASFEPSIKGTRNMIDAALASPLPVPPRLIFTSSVGTLRNYSAESGAPAPEDWITDPTLPAGAGYGESKWSAERMLQLASQQTALRPIIVRIGQLCGGANGAWNAQEWLPAIVKSGQVVKCLPAGAGVVSWLPLNVAGKAIVEMRDTHFNVVHLAHPRVISWTEIFTPIAKELGVPLVPYNDWLASLEDSMSKATSEMDAAKENPALRLIHFYRNNNADRVPPGRQAGGLAMLSTDLAVKAAPALTEAQLPKLGEKDALSWINYWRRVGHLTA